MRSYREREEKKAGCDGKQQLSKVMAERICKQSHGDIQPYKCRFCGSWHVGSHIGKVKR